MMSRWLALKLTSLLMAVFALCFVAGAGLRGALAGAMRMDLDQFAYRPASETTLYSADGEVLLQYGYRREYRADFPPLLKQTVVAMEDQRFYQHPGIDPRGILRALYVDVRLGYKAQGGSTITQQLARTLFLNNRKSILRKTEEMLIAAVLEQRFTKDEILNMYLNEVYMGRGVCGMGAAARCYFGKTPEELSPAEISYLVAMIPAPERLSPDHDAVALKKRQATVLRVMDENGLITFREADRALQQELAVRPPRARTMRHPYFTVAVLQQLKEQYGEEMVSRGGLQVYTTLHAGMQALAERTLATHVDRMAKEGIAAHDAALVSVEPATGAVRALAGGVDFSRNQVNMALVPRQPGSAIKPLIYAAAIDQQLIDDDTLLDNRERDFNGYRPRNGGSAPSRVTVRQALAHSYNVAAVSVLEGLGVERAADYLQRFGVSTLTPEDASLAMALGGLHRGISPVEMASAYAVFAADGRWHQPYFVERIESGDGALLYRHRDRSRQVVRKDTAAQVTSMLADVLRYGTGRAARISGQAAGKTGTTTSSRDLWFVGYTPELSTAVWVGNSDNRPITGGAASGGVRAAPVWRDYMSALRRAKLVAGPAPVAAQPPAGGEEVVVPAPVEPAPADAGATAQPQGGTAQEPPAAPVPLAPADSLPGESVTGNGTQQQAPAMAGAEGGSGP